MIPVLHVQHIGRPRRSRAPLGPLVQRHLGGDQARYLALHPLRQFSGHSERVQDPTRDSIQYPDEDPWIRQHFEDELAKGKLTSLMPPEVYVASDYRWAYSDED